MSEMTPEEMARRSSWYEHNGPTVEADDEEQSERSLEGSDLEFR